MSNSLPHYDALQREWLLRELENVRELKRTVQRMQEETVRQVEALRKLRAGEEPLRRAG